MKIRLTATGFWHYVGIIDGTLIFFDRQPTLVNITNAIFQGNMHMP